MGSEGGSGSQGGKVFVSTLSTSIGMILASMTKVEDMKADSKRRLTQIENEAESLTYSQNQALQQSKDLSRAVGDKLTERGLKTMIDEARMKAASAETGASGRVAEMNIKNTFMQEMFDVQIIKRQGRQTNVSIFKSQEARRLGFNQRIRSIEDSIPSKLSSGLSAINTTLAGFNTGLSLLSSSQKSAYFGTDEGTSPDEGTSARSGTSGGGK